VTGCAHSASPGAGAPTGPGTGSVIGAAAAVAPSLLLALGSSVLPIRNYRKPVPSTDQRPTLAGRDSALVYGLKGLARNGWQWAR